MKIQNGSDLWRELHTRAYYHNGSNDEKFIIEFGKKIAKNLSNCPCNKFWINWIENNPPVYDINSYFNWTVKAHNAVNLKLCKPEMSLEEAVKCIQKQ